MAGFLSSEPLQLSRLQKSPLNKCFPQVLQQSRYRQKEKSSPHNVLIFISRSTST